MQENESLETKLSFIFQSYTQHELATELGITQWSLLCKMKDNTFTNEELIKIDNHYSELQIKSKDLKCN